MSSRSNAGGNVARAGDLKRDRDDQGEREEVWTVDSPSKAPPMLEDEGDRTRTNMLCIQTISFDQDGEDALKGELSRKEDLGTRHEVSETIFHPNPEELKGDLLSGRASVSTTRQGGH
jgi:hypothetical protein